MCRRLNIHLETLPWPLNVLAFNQAIGRMQAGDEMTAISDDANVVNTLKQLLISQPELEYEVSEQDARYRIRVFRRLP